MTEENLYGIKNLITKKYIRVLARDSDEALKKLSLTKFNSSVIQLPKRVLKIYRKENPMAKTLEENLAEVQKLASLAQAILDVIKEHGAMKPKTRRKRRTKVEIAEAKAAEAPKAPKPTAKKRSHAKKPKAEEAELVAA